MNEFTELEMANAFEDMLTASLIKGLPDFSVLYREVVCQQGIPDFIGLLSDSLLQNYSFANLTATESCSVILSILKKTLAAKKDISKKKLHFLMRHSIVPLENCLTTD